MATLKEIAAILKILVSAYPDKKLPEETYQLYVTELCDLPFDLLKLAVHEHIQKSPWFPRVSDLRHIARREVGFVIFDNIPWPLSDSLNPRTLFANERDLIAAFARGEDLDHEAWFFLIIGYEMIGFLECAHRSFQRYAHYKKIIESESGA
jgi:hypothetical protein